MKLNQILLVMCVSLFLNNVHGESLVGEVSGNNPNVTVNFTKKADTSYSVSAVPVNGWIFTDAFSWSGPNGWYSDSKYNIACERLPLVQTIFVDASLCFGATMNGTMYKSGGQGGSPIPWSVSSSFQQSPNPYIEPAVSIFAKGDPQPLRYYVDVVSILTQAPGGLWKYSGATVGGQSVQTNWQNAGSSYTLPSELDAGLYSVYAARNSNGAFQAVASVTLVGVKQLSVTSGSTTVTSTTDSPSENETLYVPKGNSNSTITITATPEPGSSWPNGYPMWELNGNATGAVGSSTYSLNIANPGVYIVSAKCGTSEKRIKIIVYAISYKLNGAWTACPATFSDIGKNTSISFKFEPNFSSIVWKVGNSILPGNDAERKITFPVVGTQNLQFFAETKKLSSISICVVDNNIPTTTIQWQDTISQIANSGSCSTVEKAFTIVFTAYADIDNNKWVTKVTSINGGTTIKITTDGFRDPINNPPNKEIEADEAVTDMKGYYSRGSKGDWHTVAASTAHENYHSISEWRTIGTHYWAIAEPAIEKLFKTYHDHTKATAIANLTAAVSAKNNAFKQICLDYWEKLDDGPSSRPYAAGQLVLNSAITFVQALAQENHWTVSTGIDTPSSADPCYQPWLPYNP